MARRKKVMTFEELEKLVKEALPMADIDEDYEGQLIIYTNLKARANGDVVTFDPQ
jgi:hypothetical protein